MKAIQIQAFGQRRGLAPVPDLEMSSRAEELARSQFAQPRAIKVVYVQIPSKSKVLDLVNQDVAAPTVRFSLRLTASVFGHGQDQMVPTSAQDRAAGKISKRR